MCTVIRSNAHIWPAPAVTRWFRPRCQSRSIPKSFVWPALMAHILCCKYGYHFPLYRQSQNVWERRHRPERVVHGLMGANAPEISRAPCRCHPIMRSIMRSRVYQRHGLISTTAFLKSIITQQSARCALWRLGVRITPLHGLRSRRQVCGHRRHPHAKPPR